MTDEDYINLGIQKILGPQQGINSNQSINIGQNAELNPEQILLNSLLESRSLEIKGTYFRDSQGNEIPITEIVKGCQLNRDGYPVTFEKKLIYTLEDGTSSGDAKECMSCGTLVSKDNIFRCVVCKNTCCIMCTIISNATQHPYCSNWCKIKGEGLF